MKKNRNKNGIKKENKEREEGAGRDLGGKQIEKQVDPMFGYMSSDLNSIFAFNYYTLVLTLSLHYIVENNFSSFR